MSSTTDLFGALSATLFIIAPVAAAVLVGFLTRGPVRILGMAGFGVFAAEGVLGLMWTLLVPVLVDRGSFPLSSLAVGYSFVRGLLGLAALVLLAFAVVLDRGRPVQPPVHPAR